MPPVSPGIREDSPARAHQGAPASSRNDSQDLLITAARQAAKLLEGTIRADSNEYHDVKTARDLLFQTMALVAQGSRGATQSTAGDQNTRFEENARVL